MYDGLPSPSPPLCMEACQALTLGRPYFSAGLGSPAYLWPHLVFSSSARRSGWFRCGIPRSCAWWKTPSAAGKQEDLPSFKKLAGLVFVAGKAIKNSPSPDNQARGCTIEAALYHLINRTSKVPSLKITVSGKSCPKSCDNNLKATEKVPLAVLATVSTVTSTKLAGLS